MTRRALAPALVAGTLLCGAAGAADSIVRVTDLAPGSGDSLNGLAAAVLDGTLYFVGDPGTGPTIYRWNGVDAPEEVPDTAGTSPDELVAFDGKLYFQGGPSNDVELWVYDPSGPTVEEALDVRPGGNGVPQRFAVAGGRLCFGANTDSLGFELHCWDGVTPVEVLDLRPGPDSSFPDHLVAWGAQLAFVAQPAGDEVLMTYDFVGAPEEVEPDAGEPFELPCCLAVVGDELTFQAEAADFNVRAWRYDGVEAPTRLSTTLEPWGLQGAYRGRTFVDGENPSAGVSPSELWQQTPAGLRRVAPGTTIVGGEGHVVAEDGLYFFAYPSTEANDGVLYRYCGAGAVEAAHPDFASFDLEVSSPRPVVFAGRVMISADGDEFGEELWAVVPSHIFCDGFESGDTAPW